MYDGNFIRFWKTILFFFPIAFTLAYLYNKSNNYHNKDVLNSLYNEYLYLLPSGTHNAADPITDDDAELLIKDPSKYISVKDIKVQKKKLKGRFLHITDPHPDPYYVAGALIDESCHRDSDSPSAADLPKGSKFGDAMLGCDSPIDLVVETFNYLGRTLGDDQIDFIVWTGDNSRHDNDRQIPRKSSEIMGNNMDFSTRLSELFPDIPIIPSIGNNDIYPHNLMDIGPSLITRQLGSIYQEMIPEEQRRLYERYGSFFKEVVPGKIVILSLNSMFFFKNNPLVDSCMSTRDSGYQHLLWLGSVLNQFRAAGMKCWIISHVPLIQKNLEESCFLKVNLWIHEYRDVIIGNLMGHMNLDYFNVIKGDDLRQTLKETYFMNSLQIESSKDKTIYKDGLSDEDDQMFFARGAAPVNKDYYMARVRKQYRRLEADIDFDDLDAEQEAYHVINVAGSIIPTFNPAFRIWDYNTTEVLPEIEAESVQTTVVDWAMFFEDLEREIDDTAPVEILKKKKKGKRPSIKKDKSIPRIKPDDLPLGPAFENQFGTPLGFTQYFLKLNKLNKQYEKLVDKKKYADNEAQLIEDIFNYEVEYTSEDLLALAGIEVTTAVVPLTVKTYLQIMKGLVRNRKTWKKFLKWVYVSTGYEKK